MLKRFIPWDEKDFSTVEKWGMRLILIAVALLAIFVFNACVLAVADHFKLVEFKRWIWLVWGPLLVAVLVGVPGAFMAPPPPIKGGGKPYVLPPDDMD